MESMAKLKKDLQKLGPIPSGKEVIASFQDKAAFWKEMPDKDVQSIKNASNLDVQKVIQNQLSSFIKSHREPMIELISKVLDNNKKPDNFIVKKLYERSQKDK